MARLVFLDESGFLPAPLARRGWAPAGQTPVLYQRGRHHKKVSAVAALCVSPERRQVRLYFRLYPGKEVGTGRGIAFLKALDRELDANGCLVRDRLNAHRGQPDPRVSGDRFPSAGILLSLLRPGTEPGRVPLVMDEEEPHGQSRHARRGPARRRHPPMRPFHAKQPRPVALLDRTQPAFFAPSIEHYLCRNQ